MEGSENAINRVGRAMLTVWGYLTGAVGRYLRPEVRNEEDQNVEQEDTVPISKSYKELKVKDEEKERAETKMREDLQCPGVRVRAAAVQWEKGNFAHHEDKVKSKLTCAGSEAGDKKSQTKKDNEKPLDDTIGSRKTHGSRCTEPEDSPAKIDADAKNQDRTFSGSEEADPNVKRNETNQEQTKESEEEEKIMRIEFDETEEEPIKSGQGYQEQGNEEEEEHGEIIKRENDETETEGKTVKSEFIVQGLLAKEAELNVGRSESNQITTETLEEEGVEITRRANDETGEELTKSESIEQFLLAKEADLNVERSESFQEQKRKQEEEGVDDLMKEYEETGEELTKSEPKEADLNVERDKNNQEQGRKEEGEDEIMWRENDETEEEPMKSQFTEKDLLVKEADLRDEHSQEQRREYQEEEEESVDEILKREYEETEEEPIKSEFIEQGLLAKEVDINVERDESYQEQGKKQEEEDDEIMKSENDETEEEPIQSEFIDLDVLNVQRSECSQQQAREEEEEGVDEILRRENEEIEKDLIKSKFIDQGLLAKEADQNVEKSESSQEQRREEEKVEEGVDDILKREYEETNEEPIKSEFIEQGLLAKESDLNVERDEKYQEQGRKQEEEDDEIMKSENDETEEEPIKGEFIEQGLLAKESNLNVESDENYQEQGKEEEGVDEIMTRENDESEEEPIQSEFIDQGLLTKEVDLNVGWSEKNQAQIRKEEEEKEVEVVEIMKRENDKTEEEPIKSEFTEQGLLAKEVDVNVEQDENYQEPGREQEEEDDEIMKSDNDETEEEPIQSVEMSESIQEQRRKEEGVDEILRIENEEIEKDLIKSKFIDQGLLAKEADQNVEKSESSQEQRMEEEKEEEGVDEILRRENNESEKEPIKIEFIDQGLLTKEVDLNVGWSEKNQAQIRKEEEEKEVEDVEIMKRGNDQTEEEPIKSEFTEQGLLAKEVDVNVEQDENYQEPGREQEEEDDEIMKSDNDETEEEPIQSVEMSESIQEQRRKEEGVDDILRRENDENEEEAMKGKFIDQGFYPEEPAGVCDLGATAEVHMASMDTIMQYVYNQDKNELNVEEQSCHVTNEHENKANKLQMVDEGLFIQLASTCEGRDPLNPSLKLEVEMPENATLLQEKEVIEVHNKETMQEAVGNEKDGYHEGFSACEQFTDTSIVEEQKVCDMEMKETLKQAEVIDRDVETESELLAVTQIENAEMYKKMFEPSSGFDDEDNTVKMQQSEQSKEQKATSEMELDVELRRLDDTVHDHKGSQSPSKMTKQVFEGAITQPETETGNQRETVETTSKFRAEVAAVDVKKSAERETTSHEQPVDEEEVAAQEIAGQCFLALQGSLLEDLVSADTRINEAPFTGIKSIPLEETVVESLDEMKGSSLQELDEWSSEAELNLEAKSSSPDQTAELFERQPECEISVENDKSDKSVVSETPVETPINRNEFTEQDASSHGLSEIESEQETLEMQTDSQKDTEERKRPDEADNGLVEEIKDVTFCLGVEEEITSVLTKDSEDSEREMEERKEHTSEPESCEETSESSMNVELLSDTRECEAEMTDVETMVDSTGGEIKEMEEPIHQEEEMDKCHLVSSESEASKEISREHEEKVEHGESVVDSKEDAEDRGRSGLKRVFEKITGDNDKDKPSVLTDLLLPSQASSLDFTVQKSKIAVKNPLVRPPKDPRTLINMASVEPLTPHPPHPSLPGFLKKSHIEGASLPSKGVIGFKLPGLGSGFPALRKTEAGGKIRGREDSESVTSQKPDSGSQPADDNVKQETSPQKPKWTPPRQPGMGNPMMMAELKGKLKKPAKD